MLKNAKELSLFLAALLVTAGTVSLRDVAAEFQQGQVRDSSGVRIVEHATIKSAPVAFVIAATPRLAFGGLQNDPLLEFIPGPGRHIHRFSDGRIVVEDHYHIKLYNAQGNFRQIIGRQGQGPGEFRDVSVACVVRDDTLLVFENGVGRVSVFSPAGTHVRTVPRGGEGTVPGEPCFPDGSYLLPGRAQVDRSNGQSTIIVRRINLDGTAAATIASFAQAAGELAVSYSQFTVHDTLVFAPDEGRAAYRVYSQSGRLVSIVRWRDPPEVDQNPVAGARAGAAARGSGAPQTILPYGVIRVDNSGRVWLANHPRSASGPGFVVFSASGALLGRVALPVFSPEADGTPALMGFDGDDAVFQWRDKVNGAQHVTSHRVSAVVR